MLRNTKMGLVCLFGATALLAACQRSQSANPARVPAEPLRLDAQREVQNQPQSLAPEVKPALVNPPQDKPSPAPSRRTPPTPASLKIAPSTPAPATTPSVSPAPEKEQEMTEHANEKRVEGKTGEDDPIVTTISGCLERSRSKFRLTDMIGEHAPKSRSWKTGFFRKGSAKLDLIAETDRLKFEPHVGYRVDVTGALFKKVMHARSLNPTPARCS
jgi:hypothetical protein